MLKIRSRRAAALRTRTLLIAAMALVLPVTALASASPAMAEPKGIFKVFKQCPTEIPVVVLCSVDNTTSGEVKLGNTSVPISSTITQQGGLVPIGSSEVEYFAVPAKNGESLTKVALNVPGGLLDFIKCEEIKGYGPIEVFFRELCKHTFESGLTQVTATTELVANERNPVIFNEHNLAAEEGTTISLPVRVHLKNPLFGNSCYIGSEGEPIELEMTTGKSGSLHGKTGEEETLEEKTFASLRIAKNTLVDGAFAAPKAHECGEFFLIKGFLNFLVEGKLGIPNTGTKGENAAVFNGELLAASSEAVLASEKF
jgi:hypothetical protein